MDSLQRITICWVDLAECLPGTILLSISFYGLSVLTVTHCFPCKYCRYSFRSSLRTGMVCVLPSNFRVMSCFGTQMDEFLFCCCDKALSKSNLQKKSCILAYSSEGPESIMASMAVGTESWKFTSSNINMKQRFQALESHPQRHTFFHKATPSTPQQTAPPAED